ncbi:hypothetical protein [Mycobacterium sp. 3519A]|uniref:hypothetical protein n=1 Tax=Mycobacterium sp. 3519A TaxID=2057184 RepID=UPI000C7DC567|nr:hypothetical protein [Mycobacterium sp. 3519A]
MTIIRAELASEFRGEAVVLLAMDGTGVSTFLTALKTAEQQGAFELEHGGITHQFVIQDDSADVELRDERMVWRLNQIKAAEIIDDLTVLNNNDGPCHDYVDISSPTDTLVLSRDEYVHGVQPPRSRP